MLINRCFKLLKVLFRRNPGAASVKTLYAHHVLSNSIHFCSATAKPYCYISNINSFDFFVYMKLLTSKHVETIIVSTVDKYNAKLKEVDLVVSC